MQKQLSKNIMKHYIKFVTEIKNNEIIQVQYYR